MLLALGIVALLVVIVGVVATIMMAGRQANEDSPLSQPSDFVAPVSSGHYRFRTVDETPEQFRARVTRENASLAQGNRPLE
jgi:hypothetical protein